MDVIKVEIEMCKAVLYTSNSFGSQLCEENRMQRRDITRPGLLNPKAGESKCKRLIELKYYRLSRAQISFDIFTLFAPFYYTE